MANKKRLAVMQHAHTAALLGLAHLPPERLAQLTKGERGGNQEEAEQAGVVLTSGEVRIDAEAAASNADSAHDEGDGVVHGGSLDEAASGPRRGALVDRLEHRLDAASSNAAVAGEAVAACVRERGLAVVAVTGRSWLLSGGEVHSGRPGFGLTRAQEDVRVVKLHLRRDAALNPVLHALDPALRLVVPKKLSDLGRAAEGFDEVFVVHGLD